MLVAVGGAQEEADLVAFFERQALVFQVLESVAFEHVERGVEAEHFLAATDGIREKVGRFAVAQKRLHAVAERVHGGLVSGIEEKNRRGHEFVLGQRGAVLVARGEKLRKKVFAGRGAALGEEPAYVGGKSNGRRHGAIFHPAIAAGLIHRDHVVRPSKDLRRHVVGHAEEAGDDHDRDRFGEGGNQIGGAMRGEAVDQFVGQLFDLRTKAFDLTRQKRRIDKPAQPRVHGWFDLEQGVFLESAKWNEMLRRFRPTELLSGRDVQDLASEVPVPQECVDVMVSRKTPVAELLPMKYRVLVPPPGVKRIGVLDKGRITRVERDG